MFMESWYKVTFPYKECGESGRGTQMKSMFELLDISKGAPREAALFWATDERLTSMSYYFSPAAAELAKHLVTTNRGVTCPAPQRGAAHLAVGHDGIEDTLLSSAQDNG
jgi:hypothetical protein